MANAIATTTAGSPTVEKSKTPTYDALKGKQKRFVEEYLVDLNGAAAAIRAGYSEDSARQIASENLTKPNIALAVSELTALRTGMTQTWIIDEIAKMARASMADFATWSGNNVDLKDSDELTDDQKRLVKKINRTWGKSNSLSIELVDRQAALFKLADIFIEGAKAKKEGDTINIGQAVFVREPVNSREEWEARMKRLAEERAIEDARLIEGTKVA